MTALKCACRRFGVSRWPYAKSKESSETINKSLLQNTGVDDFERHSLPSPTAYRLEAFEVDHSLFIETSFNNTFDDALEFIEETLYSHHSVQQNEH